MVNEVLVMALRKHLLGLPGVVTRRMFGAEAYFVGPAMFAFFTPSALVLRLPESSLTEAAERGMARPFLSLGATRLNGWAEVPLADRGLEELERLLRAAHLSGTRAARSAARRKRRPPRARRVRGSGGSVGG
jgi:TfoX/Sxy family transcriptional regulator of competence genes